MSTETHPPYWLGEVARELARARAKHPSPDLMAMALAKEAGEVVKAALDLRNGKPGATWDHVHEEAIQTIVTAVRLIEEGDPLVLPNHIPTEGR